MARNFEIKDFHLCIYVSTNYVHTYSCKFMYITT